jgi:dihydroorotase
MADLLRRNILQAIGGLALPYLSAAASPGRPQDRSKSTADPATGYDLLIAGGRVIDPAKRIDQTLDVAVANGKIAAVGANLSRAGAKRVLDATGKIVTPGLIDMHGHVFDRFAISSIEPDVAGLPTGVTTIVDAGSSGASTFGAFRKYIIEPAHTRVCALLNISRIGLVVGNELYIDPKLSNPQAAIKVIQANRDVILGIKVRIEGKDEELPLDLVALKKGRIASDETGVPIMLHWTDQPSLLALLKKGDILVHPFNPPMYGPNLLGPDGKVLPQILELKERGIFTDFAHGNHLKWETAEKAAQQGWYPDTISTDISTLHTAPKGIVFDLVTTMSKFLYLGLTLDQVIEKVTVNPTKILKFPEQLGTLDVGNTADISVLRVDSGDTELFDTMREKRIGKQRIRAAASVRAGHLLTIDA